jgi:GT2 family glycosyltransferase
MTSKSIEKIAVVIPNINGEEYLRNAIDSLLSQTQKHTLIVVENASTDSSAAILASYGKKLIILTNKVNKGFAGGVNTGISYALEQDFDAIALFNNDAEASPNWLKALADTLRSHDDTGIVTGQLQLAKKGTLDSTGEMYTTWGLPFPRGRDRSIENSTYTSQEYIFGATGGASIFRASMLREIGLFDEAYFAYYEDTDISFRAQHADWRIIYEPTAIATHIQGATSKKLPGFTVYQTFKNLPILFYKNIPRKLFFSMLPRFTLAYTLILLNAIFHKNAGSALKGFRDTILLLPSTLRKRRYIQKTSKVTAKQLRSLMIDDLPPDQTGIRRLRKFFTGKP